MLTGGCRKSGSFQEARATAREGEALVDILPIVPLGSPYACSASPVDSVAAGPNHCDQAEKYVVTTNRDSTNSENDSFVQDQAIGICLFPELCYLPMDGPYRVLVSTQSGRAKACARRASRILREEYGKALGEVLFFDVDPWFQSQISVGRDETKSEPTTLILFVSTTGDGEHTVSSVCMDLEIA
jgi:hypothetical protein